MSKHRRSTNPTKVKPLRYFSETRREGKLRQHGHARKDTSHRDLPFNNPVSVPVTAPVMVATCEGPHDSDSRPTGCRRGSSPRCTATKEGACGTDCTQGRGLGTRVRRRDLPGRRSHPGVTTVRRIVGFRNTSPCHRSPYRDPPAGVYFHPQPLYPATTLPPCSSRVLPPPLHGPRSEGRDPRVQSRGEATPVGEGWDTDSAPT